MVQLRWKSTWRILKSLKIYLLHDLHHFWAHDQRTEYPTAKITAHLCTLLFYSNSLEYLWCSICSASNWWVVNKNMVYLCNTILFSKEILNYEIYKCIYDLKTIILTEVIQTKEDKYNGFLSFLDSNFFVAVSTQLNQLQWEGPLEKGCLLQGETFHLQVNSFGSGSKSLKIPLGNVLNLTRCTWSHSLSMCINHKDYEKYSQKSWAKTDKTG